MNKAMTLTYEVGTGLYINLTNACTNSCDFCIRNNGDGAYGSTSLWLLREPSASEVIDSVMARDLSKYTEVVFCGYGEPTIRLDVMLEVAGAIKNISPKLPIRVNTNGHTELIHGDGAASRFCGLIDVVSISLNTPNAKKYNDICHPVYKEKAFPALISFAKNVKNYVQKTLFSVVGDTLTKEELSECQSIADGCGVELRVREYISGES